MVLSLPRSIKWVSGISGNLVVKSKLPPCSGFVAFRLLNSIHDKGAKKFFLNKILLSMMMLIISAPHNKTFDLWLELEFGAVWGLLISILKRLNLFQLTNWITSDVSTSFWGCFQQGVWQQRSPQKLKRIWSWFLKNYSQF